MTINNTPNRARAELLLSAYGANPLRWPADERDAMHAALQQWPELEDLAVGERVLDTQLSASAIPNLLSVDAVLAHIDAYPQAHGLSSPVTAIRSAWADKHRERNGARTWQWWQLALAACVPLVLGLSLGLSIVEESDDWQGSEQYLFAPGYEDFANG
jgi:hypothetical protein